MLLALHFRNAQLAFPAALPKVRALYALPVTHVFLPALAVWAALYALWKLYVLQNPHASLYSFLLPVLWDGTH